MRPDEPLTPDQLRRLFLFESLTDEQLGWLADRGTVAAYAAGTQIIDEGASADCFFVLLSGTMALYRRVQSDDVEMTRTDHAGAYFGATQAYIRDDGDRTYSATARAITDCSLYVLAADDFGTMVRDWFPMAIHLLEGLFLGMRNSQVVIGERQRLAALGSLTAGLMHELNNPAAAAGRATSALRQRVAGMRHKLAMLADGRIDPVQMAALIDLQENVIERAAKAPALSALQTSQREDELSDWLDDHDVMGSYDLAPILAQAGIDTECLADIAGSVTPGLLDQSLRWLCYALETEQLMTDIEDATTRISGLVSAARQYSQLDRAAHQWIDVHDGLDSTLVMLTHKLGSGVRVVKEYDRSLPQVPATPAELNQVWTNLFDNAIQAMDGTGTLTVRTCLDRDHVLVEVRDTGPGIPPELRKRVFEPFFTTKPVGQGTGLGLDITYRIVVNRHGGDLSVESEPGDTRFRVRLPLTGPEPG